MRIIEIKALENGAHNNQTINGVFNIIPKGWAIVPDTLKTENFPFGDIVLDIINDTPTVTAWLPLPIPAPEEPEIPEEEPETGLEDVSYEALAQAITEGVNDL